MGHYQSFKIDTLWNCYLCSQKKFQGKVSWKYFATSHGKDVVDGIGGSAKSLVRKRVMNQGKNAVIVQNSADFYKVAKDDMKGVTVLHISEGQISELIKEKKPWENIKDVSGISKMHVISCCDGSTIEMFKTNLLYIKMRMWTEARNSM